MLRPAQLHSPRAVAIAAAVLIVIAAARIASTYAIFTGTFDEPFHIASGMEWLDKGTYTYEWQHPPLARVAVALGPYLAGLRSQMRKDANEEGDVILESNGRYQRNLALARMGNLPFFALACVIVALWAYRWFSPGTAVWAVLLFSTLPPILGHGGLATLDVGCAATVAGALYALMRWIETPDLSRSAWLGVALAAAFLTKFSSFAFLAVCCLAGVMYWILIARRRPAAAHVQAGVRFRRLLLVACIVPICLWAGYRFSLAGKQSNFDPSMAERYVSNPTLRKLALVAVEAPLPLREMAGGITRVYGHNKFGHESYLLGEFRMHGWWYFFPVVVGVKTPLGFLVLAIAGSGMILARLRTESWQKFLTVLFPLSIFLFCMTSGIDLGVRHLLSIYPMLAIVAAYAVTRAFSMTRHRSARVLAVILAIASAVESIAAHPDSLAHFNPIAGPRPEQVLVESDLDWGQDLLRLSERLKQLGVRKAAIGYFGTARLATADLPEYTILSKAEKTTGYVAASARLITLEYAKDGSYGWLRKYTPIARVGRSIFLYRIDGGTE